MMFTNKFKASENFPSVTFLYACFNFSSRIGNVLNKFGGLTWPIGSDESQFLDKITRIFAVSPSDNDPDNTPELENAQSTNICFNGLKFTMPNCLDKSFMAPSNSPAATCSPATADLAVHFCLGSTPALGATNISPACMPVGDPGWLPLTRSAAGKSISSISQPASEPSSDLFSSSSPPGKMFANGSSFSISSSSPPMPKSKSSPSPQSPPTPSISLSSIWYCEAETSPDKTPSKNPLDTVNKGQLSSFKIGSGGVNNSPTDVSTSGTFAPASLNSSAILSASVSKPCVFAVTYANG
mmetsp:Transcript_6238/g.18520  ORF Transcript_6238/g.18520 Transcript_6238/m.18520 type:complete len:297 (+) Transcript_6238:711-1601(+)